MKKILFFAIALVAGALAFTSCDSKKDNIDSPLVGTWRYQTPPAPDSGWYGVYIFTFKANGTFSLIDEAHAPGSEEMHDGFIWEGPYEIKDDIITIHKDKMGELHGDKIEYYTDYEPSDEKIKFALNGNKLTLTRDYGTEDPWTAEYTKVSGDEDEDPTDVNPEDYINTMWRIDSVYMEGEKSRPPHGIIRVLDNTTVVINGDTTSYAFRDGKLVVGEGEGYNIVAVKKGWAHLNDGIDIYLSQLPALDIENQIYTPQASDFVGTWKHAYYVGDSHIPGEPVWRREGSNPWVETWEFKEDGTCIYKDWFSGETTTGTWLYDYGILFVNNPLEYSLVDENDRITVQPLTKNWFQILRGDGTNYSYWWFVRVQ